MSGVEDVSSRDYFAAHCNEPAKTELAALGGMVLTFGEVSRSRGVNPKAFTIWWEALTGTRRLALIAKARYAMADAMLAERELAREPDGLVEELVAIKEEIILARREGTSDPKNTAFNYGLQVSASIVSAVLNRAKGEAS